MKGSGGGGFSMKVYDSANKFLGVHGASLDLVHAFGHGIVLLHHAVVQFAEGIDASHDVAEVMHEPIGEG